MITLILEGGGMRTAFTAGVLDYFIDKQLSFQNIIGVSAGAYSALSYLSKQREHTINMYTTFCRDKRHRKPLVILNGKETNIESIQKAVVDRLPFGYEQYLNNGAAMTGVATNCMTGETAYFSTGDLCTDKKYALATASLPLVSSMVEIEGVPFLDGGITDPIPVEYAMKQGYKKYVFVLTEDRTYYKDKSPKLNLIRRKYRQYPRLVEAFERQHVMYNKKLEMVYCLERMGKAIILQPSKPVKVSATEKNPEKLRALYKEGYFTASKNYKAILNFTIPAVKDA